MVTKPCNGKVAYRRVRDVTRELLDMRRYKASSVDTTVSVSVTGTDDPPSVGEMLRMSLDANPVEKWLDRTYQPASHIQFPPFLVQWYSSFGVRVVNFMAALSAGVRTLDSSVAGLGGCPFPPGTTGNAATGYILYASEYRS